MPRYTPWFAKAMLVLLLSATRALAAYCWAKVRSLPKVDVVFTFAAVAYNLVRLPRLLAGAIA